MTKKSQSQIMVDILLKNGVDFHAIKVNISALLEHARETNDFLNNYDFYKVILPLYKASIALEAVSKNMNIIDETLLNGHIVDIVRAESVLERMSERTTNVDLGSKILNLLSQIIPVALMTELGGHITSEDLGEELSEPSVIKEPVDSTKW